jgi:DNA-binding NarL/FixJ family response regulator
MNPISILITDDHTLLRETWAFIFGTDPKFKVVGITGTGEEALSIAQQFLPEIVLMDINLPGMNGIEATEKILEISPNSKVLGVSLHNEPGYARKMMQKGAMGYVTKNSTKEEMFKAIDEIVNGKKYICAEIKDILADNEIMGKQHTGLSMLSERELEVIHSLKKGNTSKEIAAELNISVKTVEVHRHNALKKLKLPNSAALIDYLHKHLNI